jgi:CRP-like cAMP-binding protein
MINKTSVLQLQVVGKVHAKDLVGEVGVLCYRPQPYTVRTKRLSQILRLSRATFLNILHSSAGDGTIIMNNFLNVYSFLCNFKCFLPKMILIPGHVLLF